jgi:hypothetical protein
MTVQPVPNAGAILRVTGRAVAADGPGAVFSVQTIPSLCDVLARNYRLGFRFSL